MLFVDVDSDCGIVMRKLDRVVHQVVDHLLNLGAVSIDECIYLRESQAEPLLREVTQQHPEHSKALRLLKFFSYIRAVPTREIPPTSIIREFLGGSSFKY